KPGAVARAFREGGPRLTWLLDDLNPNTTQPLTLAELERVVNEVANHPEVWEPRISRTSPHRMYASLRRDAHVDVWAIFWRPGNDTGWHDHDTSSGAVRVVEGELTERELRLGSVDRHRIYRAGECFSFDPSR